MTTRLLLPRASRARRWDGKRAAWITALMLVSLAGGLAGCATSGGVRSSEKMGAPLSIDCRGPKTKAPTIVLEAGAFGTSADWNRVLRSASATHRVCAYDRAGQGASPPSKEAPSSEAIARRLAATLDHIGETDPVVLAGHSNGGFYVETFARLFPDRTVGVLYVDAVGTDDLDNPLVMDDLRTEETRAEFAVIGGRMGLARFVVQGMVKAIGLKGHAADRKFRALTSAAHLENSRDEVLQIIPSLRRMNALGHVSPAIPTAVIVASLDPDDRLDQAWRAVQVAPAARACQGWVLDMVGATHVSPLGRDRAYVLAALDWLQTPSLKSSSSCGPAAFKR